VNIQKNEIDRSMHEYYEQRAEEYDDWYNRVGRYNDPRTNAAWHAQVAKLGREAARFGGMLSRYAGMRALDLCCGTGKWTPFFARSLTDSGRVVAYDYSPAMLGQTRLRLEEEDPNLLEKTLFVRGDAYYLPFASQSFDLVFFGFWLSHVPHERATPFFEEIKRVLKPGGNVLLFDSAYRPGIPREEISQRPLNNGTVHDVLKINYTPAELEKLLKQTFSESQARQTFDFFLIGQASY
jgi:demethylmenaquinone methyltransferase/2-methoxy-6-polyprenyl-1,4-benzoquinol methylase